MLLPVIRQEARIKQEFISAGTAALAAAAMTAGSAVHSANQASSTASGNAYMANMTNMMSQVQNQGYNSAEAAKTRDFNSIEALKAREATMGETALNRQFNSNEAQLARQFTQGQQNVAQEFNAAEALKNRQFQEMMSNTSYQRAVGDMKAAGLNPMLAYSQGGAQGASGSAASISAASGPAASGSAGSMASASGGQASSGSAPKAEVGQVFQAQLGNIISSAVQGSRAEAEIANIKADTKQKEATANLSGGQLRRIDDEIKLIVQQTAKEMNSAQTEDERRKLVRMQTEATHIGALLDNQKISESEAQERLINVRKEAEKMGLQGLRNTEEFEKKLSEDANGLSAKTLGMVLELFKAVKR